MTCPVIHGMPGSARGNPATDLLRAGLPTTLENAISPEQAHLGAEAEHSYHQEDAADARQARPVEGDPRRDMMARVAPAMIIESTETICCADRATATRVEMTMAMAVLTVAAPTAPPSTAVTWSSGGRNRPGGAAHVDGDHRHGERQGRDQGGEQDGGQGFCRQRWLRRRRRREQRFARAPLALASEGVGRHARGDHRWKEQERPADPGSRRPAPRLERGHDHADDRGQHPACTSAPRALWRLPRRSISSLHATLRRSNI